LSETKLGPGGPLLGPRTRRVTQLRRLIRKPKSKSAEALLESPRAVSEALDAGVEVTAVVVPPSAYRDPVACDVLGRLNPRTEVLNVTEEAFDSLATTVTPQRMLATALRDQPPLPSTLDAGDLVVVLANVYNPGNIGTIIRSSHACAARCVVVVGGSNPWSPKSIRASSGSAMRLPIICSDDTRGVLGTLRTGGARIVASDAHRGQRYDSGVLSQARGPVALVLGSEANGPGDSVDDMVDDWVRIPMTGETESLNVAMAATVLVFEYRRHPAPQQ